LAVYDGRYIAWWRIDLTVVLQLHLVGIGHASLRTKEGLAALAAHNRETDEDGKEDNPNIPFSIKEKEGEKDK